MSNFSWGAPPKFDLTDRISNEMLNFTQDDRNYVISLVVGMPQLRSMNVKLVTACLNLISLHGQNFSNVLENLDDTAINNVATLLVEGGTRNIARLKADIVRYLRAIFNYIESNKAEEALEEAERYNYDLSISDELNSETEEQGVGSRTSI
jgi:hypothetical protein